MNFELDIDNILLEDCNSSFMKYFDIQNFSVVCEKNDLSDLDILFSKEFVPVKGMSFNVELDEKSNVFNSDFRKEFGIHNFEVCLNEKSSINDFLFEEHFNINQSFDYSIIENLKKDLNSRKILTREERESVPEKEPEVFNIENKETISLDEEIENKKEVIKENSFYRIVEFDSSEVRNIPTKVEPSYKDEVEQQLVDMENKYEDLLQKTKEVYQSQLNKMMNDFSEFRNHINQQVSRMAFISSSAGGGAVNILDMDDVDVPDEIPSGALLRYNKNMKKFVVDAAGTGGGHQVDFFTITDEMISQGFVELSFEANPEFFNSTTVEINGLVNLYPLDYTFRDNYSVDITNLDIVDGDNLRVVYTKL